MSGIWRVPAAGGESEPVIEPDPAVGKQPFRWPDLLPGGRTLIFAPDRLAFARGSALFVAQIDLERLEIVGEPVQIFEDLGGDPSSGIACYAVAPNGSLA